MIDKNLSKRINMMKQFIDSAFEISETDGFETISVRNFAAKTNYNSSTIYYYFVNFDNFLAYVSLKHLDQFFYELGEIEQNYINSVDLFIKTFDLFIKYVLKYPKQFQAIMLGNHNVELEEIIKTYSQIYPEDNIRKDSVFPIFKRNSVTIIPTLSLCISHGHIKVKSYDKIIELMESIFNTLISKSLEGPGEEENLSIEARYNEYIKLFIHYYKTPICILTLTDT